MNFCLAIVGPTGVGKTDLSQALALEFNAEIINSDSLLFYRGMDIGTAKPKKFLVPHHLIDCAEPHESYDIEKFRTHALQAINNIQTRKKNIFIVGGSGFYLRALSEGIYDAPHSYELRDNLEKEATPELYERLQKLDPEASQAIHPHDRYRTIRALEMMLLSGKKASEIKKEFKRISNERENLKIKYMGLDLPRDELHERIHERTKKMLSQGFEDEVCGLLKKYPSDTKSLQSVGYKQMVAYLRKEITLSQCHDEIALRTRQLAKRQLTWFRNQLDVTWFHPLVDRNLIYDFINKIATV